MTGLGILAFLALMGLSSSETSDCSYIPLLKHLNLTPANDLLMVTRPVKHWKTATTVFIDMILYGILEVDEKSQTVTSLIWTEMSWQNEFLTWNSADFCGIDMVTIPRTRLWIPDLGVQEDTSDTGTVQKGPQVSIYPSGYVKANAKQRMTFTCQFNLRLFPFDTQKCNITFGSNNYAATHLTLGSLRNDSVLYYISQMLMVTQGEWELLDLEINVYSTKATSRLAYTVTIKRRPMLYIVIIIVPLFYFMILDLASFFISEARGEKLGFKVTILLSISVLLLILKDMLPSTEAELPMMAVYCIVTFALVGISVLEAMLVSFLVDLEEWCGGREEKPAHTEEDVSLDVLESYNPGAEVKFPVVKADHIAQNVPLPLDHGHINPAYDGDLLKLILDDVKSIRLEVGKPDKDSKKNKKKYGGCRRAAEIIDSVFFCLYFITVVGALGYMYAVWIVNYK